MRLALSHIKKSAYILVGLALLLPGQAALSSAPSWSRSSPQAFKPPKNSDFGFSVGLISNLAIVGTEDDLAYIFAPAGHGAWHYQATLRDPSSQRDGFGSATAISSNAVGPYAVVGAPDFDTSVSGTNSAGIAYIYRQKGASWRLKAILRNPAGNKPSGNKGGFASIVAASGNTIVTATSGDTNDIVYIWNWSGRRWRVRATLTNPPGSPIQFGDAIATSGNTVVVGAQGGNSSILGAAYVYVRWSTGQWKRQAKLSPPQIPYPNGVGNLGISVAISGSTVVVGAENPVPGSAFVYGRSGTHWHLKGRLLPHSTSLGDGFGTSVAISGARIVVGDVAIFHPRNTCGGAYEFVKSRATWQPKAVINADCHVTPDGAQFGWASALAGRTALFGAPGADNGTGSAFILKLPA